MKLAELMALVNAGFTKEEIMKMTSTNGEQKPKEDQKPNEEQKPKEDHKPDSTNSEILKAITELTKTIQASNIINSSQPDVHSDTVDDILAGILNPVMTKEDDK